MLDQAINEAVPQFYVDALREHSLVPLAQPEIEVTKFEDGEVIEFTAEVDVQPTIELPNYEGLEVSVSDVSVSDDEVDADLAALRERFATLNDVERAAADGDFVSIDLAATHDGEVARLPDLATRLAAAACCLASTRP